MQIKTIVMQSTLIVPEPLPVLIIELLQMLVWSGFV